MKWNPLPRRERLEAHDHVAVLPSPAHLARELLLHHYGRTQGLAVGDLGLADERGDPVLLSEPAHEDLEMEFPHPRDDRLVRRLVYGHAERWVLARESG